MSESRENLSQSLTALWITNAVLAVLAVAIGGGAAYAAFVYEPEAHPRYRAKVLAEVEERLEAHQEQILAEAESVAQETLPVVGEAVYEQAQEDYGRYVRVLERQGEELVDDMETIFINKVKGQYREYLRAHRQVIAQEFPEHASEENIESIVSDFEQMLDRLVERYYLDEFRAESKQTLALWKKIEPLEPPGPTEPSLEEQLADYTADWATLAFTEPPAAPAETAGAE